VGPDGTKVDRRRASHCAGRLRNEAAEGAGFEALAATHSRELAKVSSDIAAAIRRPQ